MDRKQADYAPGFTEQDEREVRKDFDRMNRVFWGIVGSLVVFVAMWGVLKFAHMGPWW